MAILLERHLGCGTHNFNDAMLTLCKCKEEHLLPSREMGLRQSNKGKDKDLGADSWARERCTSNGLT